jgi:hypothetical protein
LLPHKRTVIIHVHPPEAEAIAKAYGAAFQSAQAVLERLGKIQGTLDSEWEGHQRDAFLVDFEQTLVRIRDYLLPLLKEREKKYHGFMAEKVIEEGQYY